MMRYGCRFKVVSDGEYWSSRQYPVVSSQVGKVSTVAGAMKEPWV